MPYMYGVPSMLSKGSHKSGYVETGGWRQLWRTMPYQRGAARESWLEMLCDGVNLVPQHIVLRR